MCIVVQSAVQPAHPSLRPHIPPWSSFSSNKLGRTTLEQRQQQSTVHIDGKTSLQ